MPDRADYLAKSLLRRRRSLETGLAEDPPADLGEEVSRRQEMVAKVLAVEANTTDAVTVQRVLNALPHYAANREDSDRATAEFAAFLRQTLIFD